MKTPATKTPVVDTESTTPPAITFASLGLCAETLDRKSVV